MNLGSISAPHWAVCSGCEQSALGVVTSSASNDKSVLFGGCCLRESA